MAKNLIGNVYPTDDFLLARCAPAGYGVGVKNGHACTDCNEAILNGTYYIFGESALNHPGHSMQYGCMDVKRRGNYITQIVHYDYYEVKRFSHDGGDTWGEWEWENPPMEVGVEYLTTERWQGKPVYRRLVTFKLTEATSGEILVPHGISNFGGLVRQSAVLQDKFPLPYMYGGNTAWVSTVNDTNIIVSNTGLEWDSSYTWNFDLYYTKTTG
jgi:hypothetical protein